MAGLMWWYCWDVMKNQFKSRVGCEGSVDVDKLTKAWAALTLYPSSKTLYDGTGRSLQAAIKPVTQLLRRGIIEGLPRYAQASAWDGLIFRI